MSEIKFIKEEKDLIVQKIKSYFIEELDQEIAQFDAEFLLDFFNREVGPYYYNNGLYDAKTLIEDKLEILTDAFYELEKPTDFIR